METEISSRTAGRLLGEILRALMQEVPFVILRNYEDLPLLWKNDVDLLIRPSDLVRSSEICLRVANAEAKDCAISVLTRFHLRSILVACSDRLLRIDLFTAMSKGWIIYADTDKILAARSRRHELFCIPDPYHELLLIAAKELFAYGYIRPRYHSKLTCHDWARSQESSRMLFDQHLTDSGCLLIAKALINPEVKGRPGVLPGSLLRPAAIFSWMLQRLNNPKLLRVDS